MVETFNEGLVNMRKISIHSLIKIGWNTQLQFNNVVGNIWSRLMTGIFNHGSVKVTEILNYGLLTMVIYSQQGEI